MTSETPTTLGVDMLIGRFFHTTVRCQEHGLHVVQQQGRILGAPAPGLLLIETFEWLMGESSGQKFITLDDFVARNPVLYDSAEDMRFSFDHGRLRHSSRCEATK